MLKVFISYSSKSKPKVQNLAQDLEMAGHQIWFDHKLTGGQAWWDQILEQIRQCEMFIFALTPDALDSYPCKLEYTYAHDLGKHVLPVLLDDGVSVNLLPPALTTIQFVDYRGNDKQAAFRLVNAINGLPPCKPLPDPLPPSPPVPISYIGNLKEQIDSPSPLTFDEQAALVIKIKEHLQNPDSRDDAATLLRQMRKRDDLYARIGEEIDSLLKPTVPAPAPEPAPAPRPAPISTPTPEPYRPPQSVTTPAQQRVVVTPPQANTAAGSDQPWHIALVLGLAIGTFFIPLIGLAAGFIALRKPANRNIGIGLLVFGGIMAVLYVLNALGSMGYYW